MVEQALTNQITSRPVGLLGRLSIKRKLLLVIMIVSATAILLVAATFLFFQWLALNHSIENDLTSQAVLLAENCTGPMAFGYTDEAEQALAATQGNALIQMATLYRADGSLFASWARKGQKPGPLPTPSPENGILYDHGQMMLFQEIALENEHLGTLCLHSDPKEMYAFLRLSLLVLPLSMLLSLLVAYLLATQLQRVISGPVSALTETARGVARSEDYSLRAVKTSADELGVLTDTFNLMLAQVENRDAALRESRQNLQTFFDTLDDLLFVLDTEGRILRMNPVVLQRLGYSAEELTGMPISEVHSTARLGELKETLTEVLAGHTELCTVPLQTRQGELIPVETKMTTGQWGGQRALFGIARDISERLRTEEALRLTQFSVDNSADAAYWIGPDGRFVYANHAACRVLGYTLEELLDLSIHDIDPFCDEETWPQIWQRVRAEGSIAIESRHRTKDGLRFPVEITANFVDFEGQEYNCVFARDISERKLAEEEVRRLRNLLSNIIDSMPSVLIGVDRRGEITQWNREATRVTGVPADRARGCFLPDMFPQLAREMPKVFEAIETRSSQKDLKVPHEREGEIRYSDVTVYPLDADGIEGAVIRVDDVTERVRIEEMMIQSEKMLSVGGLAAGMAHEINNPLAGILQNIQVMRNRVSTGLKKNRRTAEEAGTSMDSIEEYMRRRGIFPMFEAIISSGQRAAQIVKNMLSFSRKSDTKHARHDLAELLDRTVELACNDYDLKKKYDFRKIEIVREYDPEVPPVACEASKIQQVFLNLLRNGAESMVNGSHAYASVDGSLGPHCFTLRLLAEPEMARIEIEDNGPGMDETVRRRVFEPFFTTKGAGIGTGLGLSVSYFIITENHLGTMSVESAPGKGARFIIRLPLGGSEL